MKGTPSASLDFGRDAAGHTNMASTSCCPHVASQYEAAVGQFLKVG